MGGLMKASRCICMVTWFVQNAGSVGRETVTYSLGLWT